MGAVEMRLLLIGVNDTIDQFVIERSDPSHVQRVATAEAFLEFLETPPQEGFHLIIVGPGLESISMVEMAQSLRGTFQETPIFYSHNSRAEGFDRQDYVKNGFTDAFLFPLDSAEFSSVLESAVAEIKKVSAFRSVKMIDLQAGDVLDFDVHLVLPMNRKYVRYSTAGRSLDSSRVEKLKTHRVDSVFVPLDQMRSFYSYAATKLKSLSEDSATSETERQERLQGAVRELMSGIFSTRTDAGFDVGKQMMADAGEIVKSFLTQSSQSGLYDRIAKVAGGMNNGYSHLSNVSTLAALFSMATGVGKPEDLALAGLFHDIGLSSVPYEVQAKTPGEWTPEEQAAFQSHPEKSLDLVKTRKIVLPQSIQTVILQHHERADGKGYPLGLTEPKLKPESQILAIADEFDELTKFEMGKRSISPEEALTRIRESGAFNIELVNKLCIALKAA
jgi:HD-GYP domain-containing protein (c-di-GMP phosphodiesterase class II)